MAQIKSFGIFQTSKFAGVMWFAFTGFMMIPYAAMFLVIGTFAEKPLIPFPIIFIVIFMIVLPFIYGVFGFLFTALGCWVYNLVSSWVGGIEIEID